MRPYRVTLILGGILLLCLLYLYTVERPKAQRDAEEQTRATRLVGFTSADVRGMTLQYRGRKAVEIEKRDGQWWLTKPLHDRADQIEVEDVIRDLTVAKVTRVLNEPDSDLGQYGLSPPQLTLSFVMADREERLLIGEKGPVSLQLYVKRPSDPQVYLTNLPDRDILSKTPDALRRKEIIDVDREDIDRLALDHRTGSVSLVASGRTWFVDAPIEGPADPSVVGALLTRIENLKAVRFIDAEKEKEAVRAQLGAPHLVLHVQERNETHVVTFFTFSNDAEWAYAVTTPDHPMALLPSRTVNTIPTSLFMLRDKRLVVVDRSRAAALDIATPHRRDTVPIESADHPLPHPVREYMNRVLNVEAEIPVRDADVTADDLRAFGLDAPALRVRVLGHDGTSLGSLLVSEILDTDDEKAGSAHAHGSSLPGIYGIRSGILMNLPVPPDPANA